MRILIVTHAARGSTKGNRITAERWSQFFRDAGHEISISDQVPRESFDCLIALHATFASELIPLFRTKNPTAKTIVCLTGTDLHLDLEVIAVSGNKYLLSTPSLLAISSYCWSPREERICPTRRVQSRS